MSFTRQLNQFKSKAVQNIIKCKRLAAFDLFSSIILETPVDKGVLRNNWFVQIGSPSRKTTQQQDGGSGAVSRAADVLVNTTLQEDIFFNNNLPYAVPIEFDGHSAKAPEGMVRVNTVRWDQIVSRTARRVARGS